MTEQRTFTEWLEYFSQKRYPFGVWKDDGAIQKTITDTERKSFTIKQ